MIFGRGSTLSANIIYAKYRIYGILQRLVKFYGIKKDFLFTHLKERI